MDELLYDVFMRIGQYQIEGLAVVTESRICDGLSLAVNQVPNSTRFNTRKARWVGARSILATSRLPAMIHEVA
jgi:hypothetical protein